MRISLQKDHGRLDVLNEWLRRKCPQNFAMDYEGKTYKIENGELNILDHSGPIKESSEEMLAVTDNAKNNALLMRDSKAKNRKLIVRQPVTDNRVCLTCQNPFYSKRRDAKYCSQRCRQRAKRDREAQRQLAEYERVLTGS